MSVKCSFFLNSAKKSSFKLRINAYVHCRDCIIGPYFVSLTLIVMYLGLDIWYVLHVSQDRDVLLHLSRNLYSWTRSLPAWNGLCNRQKESSPVCCWYINYHQFQFKGKILQGLKITGFPDVWDTQKCWRKPIFLIRVSDWKPMQGLSGRWTSLRVIPCHSSQFAEGLCADRPRFA